MNSSHPWNRHCPSNSANSTVRPPIRPTVDSLSSPPQPQHLSSPFSTSLISEISGKTVHLAASLGLAAILGGFGGPKAIAAPTFSTSASEPVSHQAFETRSASDPVLVAQATTGQLVFVNPAVGNDASGDGSQRSPFRTLTHALQAAQPNTVIVLAPGTYSSSSGEAFPIRLRPNVTIQGDPGSRGRGIVIRGGGEFLSPTFAGQNVALLGADNAVLTGVTVTNPNPRGYGLWIESSQPIVMNNTFSDSTHDGISVTGTGRPRVQNNLFSQNGANGITIYGSSQAEVRNNVFDDTGFGINIGQNAAPTIVDNQIVGNRDGLVLQANARPTLRNNTIANNERDGLVAIAQSLPNLGTATEAGNNVFQNNGRHDINAEAASQPFPAFGNQLNSSRTIGSIDFAGTTPVPAAIASSHSTAGDSVPAVNASAQSSSSVEPLAQSTETEATVATFPTPTALNAVPAADSLPRLNLAAQINEFVPPPASPNANGSAASVEIPVPAPAASSSASSAPARQPLRELVVTRPETASAPRTQSTAVEIPVPRPVSAPSATTMPSSNQVLPRPENLNVNVAVRNPLPNSDLLPVPGGNIPLGNIGNMPTVRVASNPLNRTAGGPPSVPSRATALGLRYRVVVEADSEGEQEQVRALIPDAFRTYANGRVVMQVGAYSDRANADETVERLTNSGLRAIVQQLE